MDEDTIAMKTTTSALTEGKINYGRELSTICCSLKPCNTGFSVFILEFVAKLESARESYAALKSHQGLEAHIY
jgi:hypothetical protein